MKHKEKRKHLESRYPMKTVKMSTARLNLPEDAWQQHTQKTVDQLEGWKTWGTTSSSGNLSCTSSTDKLSDAESYNIGECAPRRESHVEAPTLGQTEGNSSCSAYFTCVSSPSKIPCPDDDGILEMPVSQDLECSEMSPLCSRNFSPFHLVNNDNSFMSSVRGRDERVMTIYYMPVQMKRGVAVLLDPEVGGLEPLPKKIKMEEITYIEKIHKNAPFPPMSRKKHLIKHEPILDSGAQEKGKNNDHPAEPSATEEYPRVKTPEWLVAQSSGFRCMACCRVFPSTVALQEHVEHGVKEGFSCHTFHLALAHLKHKTHKEEDQHKIKKPTFRCQKEKHVGMKTISY